jgi:hypothetical protein
MPSQPKRTANKVAVYVRPIEETDRLSLAKWLLAGVALLLTLGCIAYLVNDGPRAEKIFQACITTLPPIATLVIGYYFAQSKK